MPTNDCFSAALIPDEMWSCLPTKNTALVGMDDIIRLYGFTTDIASDQQAAWNPAVYSVPVDDQDDINVVIITGGDNTSSNPETYTEHCLTTEGSEGRESTYTFTTWITEALAKAATRDWGVTSISTPGYCWGVSEGGISLMDFSRVGVGQIPQKGIHSPTANPGNATNAKAGGGGGGEQPEAPSGLPVLNDTSSTMRAFIAVKITGIVYKTLSDGSSAVDYYKVVVAEDDSTAWGILHQQLAPQARGTATFEGLVTARFDDGWDSASASSTTEVRVGPTDGGLITNAPETGRAILVEKPDGGIGLIDIQDTPGNVLEFYVVTTPPTTGYGPATAKKITRVNADGTWETATEASSITILKF